MAAGHVPSSCSAYYCQIFVNESEKAADIHCRLQLQFGEACLSSFSVFQWCHSFKDGCEPVSNMPYAALRAAAVD
jgi:hypothetical protein